MNGNQLDDLFKQKLGNQKLTPSANSWDQIENNLKEKKVIGISLWIKIAASFVLLFTIGWLLIPSNNEAISEGDIKNEVVQVPTDVKIDTSIEESSKINIAPLSLPSIDNFVAKQESVDNSLHKLIVEVELPKQQESQDVFPVKREVLKDIPQIKLNYTSNYYSLAQSNHSQVLPLDVSIMYNYSSDRIDEVNKRRKFSMMNGIISIAKGVNNGTLGFEGLRNAKNDFINEELKQNTKETDAVVEENGTKSDDLNK